MSEWEKVNGTQVMPPKYEKKVGRPPKSRRKQPSEVQGKYGPKLSKHGLVMHCKHCSEANHNSGGCKLKKMGFSSADAKHLVATTQATLQAEAQAQAQAAAIPVVEAPAVEAPSVEAPATTAEATSTCNNQDMETPTQASTTMISQMFAEKTQVSRMSQPHGGLPDSAFILANKPVERQMPLTTSTKKGKAEAARKRKTMTASTDDKAGATRKRKATAARSKQPSSN
ncbi:hypothetical protein BS78_K134100 [Paspalum vaginatum]|uniref:Uncharacterized protein n=1 Tax=Paspalum vaginatum TaxID=158149 RepID=A0A9W7X8G0_9POAL|nr:hypothetical protein BS78_K134100 [Paspalum vaginatum]